ncbi:Serine/threonine protein kinase Mitochondrial [Chondrus crispus]|uniref:Serine/threonine protein kinase Mitochondrial n=1 Tax=Chondrus crispus TaxID=2769 RepID=R7Q9G9_CHOCR|nr:Serine/threonine protein kinase Mitochondrial [Chondrus crispus]CDF34704.1 Serine/threonine protein kinase Mitochondrial [Chondrus crispus]|eukprot:XP_005714523.1 Serine/threonine protein kinase Mitochondrial [Chondrus crispus]
MTSRVARAPVAHTPSRARVRTYHPPSSTLAALLARYDLLNHLGAGCAGTVVRAVDKASRSNVAVKIVPKHLLVDRGAKMALAREVSVLSKLAHPHVVRFSNAFEDDHHVYIATEFCPRGDLYQYLKRQPRGLPEREALKYLRQILQGLDYLHERGISHRDLKPENVLMTANGRVKLADFGMCYWRRPGGDMSTRQHCGTPQYAAPEIMRKVAYVPEQADMWACGVVLYAMLTRSLPFVGADWARLKYQVTHADAEQLIRSSALAPVSEQTLHLLKRLLATRPGSRPGPKEAGELVDDALLGVRRSRGRRERMG